MFPLHCAFVHTQRIRYVCAIIHTECPRRDRLAVATIISHNMIIFLPNDSRGRRRGRVIASARESQNARSSIDRVIVTTSNRYGGVQRFNLDKLSEQIVQRRR